MAKHGVVADRLASEGKLAASAALMPTTSAVTVRSGAQSEPMLIDGLFAETKEQLLGFYIVECETLDEALAAAKEIGWGEAGGAGGASGSPLRVG